MILLINEIKVSWPATPESVCRQGMDPESFSRYKCQLFVRRGSERLETPCLYRIFTVRGGSNNRSRIGECEKNNIQSNMIGGKTVHKNWKSKDELAMKQVPIGSIG